MKSSCNRLLPGRVSVMRFRGLTFIEILILFAAVAILLVILLPTVSLVRAKSRKAECISNLRQIGMALDLYAQDYNGYFPPWRNTRLPADGMSPRWSDPESLSVAVRWKTKNSEVLFCPTDDDAGKDIERYGVNHLYSSYFYNTRPPMGRRCRLTVAGLSVDGATKYEPADYPMVRDANTVYVEGRKAPRATGCGHFRGVNVLYLDWHVKWKSPEQ